MKHRVEDDAKGNQHPEREALPYKENLQEAQDMVRSRSGYGEGQESNVGRSEMKEAAEFKDKHSNRNLDHRDGIFARPQGMKKIDTDKVKAALEKRRKAPSHITKKAEFINDDDFIERELEDGIELPAQIEKNKQDRKHGRHQDHADEHIHGIKGLPSYEPDLSAVEEGEVSALDDIGIGNQSPKSSNRKRKAGSSPDRGMEGKQRHNYGSGPHHHNRFDYMEDRNKVSRLGHTERDSKRHVQENHV